MALTRADAEASGAILECILYGAYVVLFVQYLTLQHDGNHRLDGSLPLAHIFLFGLCTLSFCLEIPAAYLRIVPDLEDSLLDMASKLDSGSIAISALIDYMAQMILLYRCWIIWGRRWVVVAVPGFLAPVTLGGGLALFDLLNPPNAAKVPALSTPTGIVVNSFALVVNALIASLIMTKIFLTSREVRILGSSSSRPLHIATAMLIESGLLMFTFQLVFVVFYRFTEFAIISGATAQIYGITPTLLSIWLIMDSAYDETAEQTTSLGLPQSEGATTEATATSVSAAEVRPQSAVMEPGAPNNEKAAADVV
ncbi:hypothetical protein BD779DRAFT_1677377 [Infundibulicybe gibba]|nr:hypothetical protein BD779DRAFT_1677377 [Infundibulicybe gibba]